MSVGGAKVGRGPFAMTHLIEKLGKSTWSPVTLVMIAKSHVKLGNQDAVHGLVVTASPSKPNIVLSIDFTHFYSAIDIRDHGQDVEVRSGYH